MCQHLNHPPKSRVRGHSTFRRVILELDFQVFAQVFNQWAQQYVPIEPGEWLAVDGKSIKGSVTDYETHQQNFVMLVSLFSHKCGFVLHSQPMENKVISELHVVQQLLEVLDLSGAVVTADALHTQENGRAPTPAGGPLSAVCESQPSQVV
ncbi:ISAs1 family transposase [Trichocoleus desertorum AS-A10]|uniref:ISAs1 family transposase n=1 Tax=Trichocoleus desertorum TaxID=1481672 RepID=UPI003298C744